MWKAINTTGHWQGEMWNRHKDGALYLETTSINTICHDDGTVHRYVSLFSDITKKRASEKLIWQQANYDMLTNLPNRHMFHDRLAQAIKKSNRSGLPMALLMLDLDRFKEVNDSLGHSQGDKLLVLAAQRITECVRETDTVARLGGDEFTVILCDLVDLSSAERIAQNIIECLCAPFELGLDKVYVFASVGITLYPNDSLTVETLIKNADQAMYVAKNLGGNRFSYFTKDLQLAADSRVNMIKDLRAALAAKQLAVHYQPIVEMATGKIHKAEALLRWQHPVLGMISPALFIPLAEDSGLIHEIGDWVFHEAIRELSHWRKNFVPEFQISVNKSPVQLRQNKAKIGSSWIEHLHAMGLPGQSLVIEITEGLLLNAEAHVVTKLQAFRDAGIQVAMDDFGTGYSSLAYLKKFDLDYIKIDQSFVRNLVDGSADKALCEAIIVMAHKLGLKVIAEGVETKQQRDVLAAFGCDYAQGWLYSKAIPAKEFEAMLKSLD
jgi:diguanylate cyclase (GGDEF)-like protein